jgi:hypothetical protein
MSIVEFTKPIDVHSELNPKLWDGEHLRKDVRVALLKIAKEYYNFLEIDVPLMDLIVTGSQANFNYTEYSDLDLHLIVPYDRVQCDMAVDKLFRAKRDLWRKEHDIEIHGVPVELYAEDVEKPVTGSTYSVVRGLASQNLLMQTTILKMLNVLYLFGNELLTKLLQQKALKFVKISKIYYELLDRRDLIRAEK